MKTKLLPIYTFFIASCFALQGQNADDETSISVQIRPRAEYRNGAIFPRYEGEEAAGFVNNRARLSLDYSRDKLSMKVSGQHVGVWGQDPQVDKNGRFMLNEAWAKLYLTPSFFAQLGRQSLIYDDERILGGLDWNTSGRFHDVLKVGFENKQNKLHLILAFNQNDEKVNGGTYYAPGGQPYKLMQTLWYNYAKSDFSLSALFMNLGQEGGDMETQKADTRYLQTFGTHINYTPDAWKFQGAFYYQTGKTVADVSVSAWMAALKASYQINHQWSAGFGSDFLSGDKNSDSKYKTFNPLYGTHHKFYGSMDYFYASSFINGVNPGLLDLYGNVAFTPSKSLNLSLTYHNFSITKKVEDNSGKELKKGLGSEFDFQLDWTIMKDVKLSGGYSVMFGTETMDFVKGGDHSSWQDWGWVSLNISPRVFYAK